MKKILVAGATGYLGQFVVKALKAKGYWVRALGRSAARLESVEEYADELFVGEVTEPDSIAGACDGIDCVFSSVGITRQKDGMSYRDVDYQANSNLLAAAEAAGVSKFVYVHVLNADKLAHVDMVQAKQAFVDELRNSSLEYTVVYPTGFFSDMEEFLSMARSGRIYLIGDGQNRINPIHGADLAEFCAGAIEIQLRNLEVGGPDILNYREIAGMAFAALDQTARITHLPTGLVPAVVTALRWLTPVRIHGPIDFMASVMTMDVVGHPYGERRLKDYFRDCCRSVADESSEDHPLPV